MEIEINEKNIEKEIKELLSEGKTLDVECRNKKKTYEYLMENVKGRYRQTDEELRSVRMKINEKREALHFQVRMVELEKEKVKLQRDYPDISKEIKEIQEYLDERHQRYKEIHSEIIYKKHLLRLATEHKDGYCLKKN